MLFTVLLDTCVRERRKLHFINKPSQVSITRHLQPTITMYVFPKGIQLVTIIFVNMPIPCQRNNDATYSVHHILSTKQEASLFVLSFYENLYSPLKSPENRAYIRMILLFSHSSQESFSLGQLHAGRTLPSQIQKSAIGAYGNDYSESSDIESIHISKVSASLPISGMCAKSHVSRTWIYVWDRILHHGEWNKDANVFVRSRFDVQGVSPGCFMLYDVMKLSTSVYCPFMCRQSLRKTDTVHADAVRKSVLLLVGIISEQYAYTLVVCSSCPIGGVLHHPHEINMNQKHDNVSTRKLQFSEPVQYLLQNTSKLTSKQFYPFWSTLFNFLGPDLSLQENHQPEIPTHVHNVALDPVIKEIILLLMILVMVLFRYLPQSFEASKTKNHNNSLYLKILIESFFQKWEWTRGRQEKLAVAAPEGGNTSVAAPEDSNTSEKGCQSLWWKCSQLDILNSFIFRPWLTKATSRQRQSCCSSTSSLCSSCQGQLNNYLANSQRNLQVSPAFLPLPSLNPGIDLAHVGYRLATLAAITSSPVSRLRLADAGFYSRGHEDEVICYSCGVHHSGWQARDNPMDIHRQLSPNCQHVLQRDQELMELETVSQNAPVTDPNSGSGHIREADPSHSQSHPTHEEDSETSTPSASAATTSTSHTSVSETRCSTSNASGTSETVSPASARMTAVHTSETVSAMPAAPRAPMFPRPMLDLGRAVYPAFSSIANRRRTFTGWDESQAPPLNEILVSGMFYAGYADCVRCFYCGVGLKNWVVTDSVWDEHVRWRPDCGYLRAIKGDRFIQEIQRRLGVTPSPTNDQIRGRQPPPQTPSGLRQPASNGISATTTTTTTTNTTNTTRAALSDTGPTPSASGTCSLTSSSAQTAEPSPAAETGGTPAVIGSVGMAVGPAVLVSNTEERVVQHQEEHQRPSNQVQCRVCRQAPVNMILLPCAHLVVCESCSGSVTSCPLCHEAVRARLQITLELPP